MSNLCYFSFITQMYCYMVIDQTHTDEPVVFLLYSYGFMIMQHENGSRLRQFNDVISILWPFVAGIL